MPVFMIWTKASMCRWLYIKSAILVYEEYIMIASFLPLVMAVFVFSRCLTLRVKGDFSYELILLVGACEWRLFFW